MIRGLPPDFGFSSYHGCHRRDADVPILCCLGITRSVHICSLVASTLLLCGRRRGWSSFYSNKVSLRRMGIFPL